MYQNIGVTSINDNKFMKVRRLSRVNSRSSNSRMGNAAAPQDEPNPGSIPSSSRYYFQGELYQQFAHCRTENYVCHTSAFELISRLPCKIHKQLTYTNSTPTNPQHKPSPYGIGGENVFLARHPSSSRSSCISVALSRIVVVEQSSVAYHLASREYSDLGCYIRVTWERNPNFLVAPTHTS
jgi:hypothetical protein